MKAMTLIVAATITLHSANADVKVTGTETSGTPPPLNTKFGKVVNAINLGGNTLKCDGVTFTGQTVSGGTSQVIQTVPFNVKISTTDGNLASAPIGDDALFQTEVYSDSFRNLSLLIEGLDSKKTYQVQYLHGETRNEIWARYSNGTQTFTDSSGNKVTSALTFNTELNKNQFVVVTVEVTGSTSLLCTLPHSEAADGRGPSFSGYVVLEKQ